MADGPLHRLPFEALVTAVPPGPAAGGGAYEKASYLSDGLEIEHLPSARLLAGAALGAAVPPARRLLVLAHGAPGAAAEAEAIEAAFPGRAELLLDGNATEDNLGKARAPVDVLHFAVHASADERDPLASFWAGFVAITGTGG